MPRPRTAPTLGYRSSYHELMRDMLRAVGMPPMLRPPTESEDDERNDGRYDQQSFRDVNAPRTDYASGAFYWVVPSWSPRIAESHSCRDPWCGTCSVFIVMAKRKQNDQNSNKQKGQNGKMADLDVFREDPEGKYLTTDQGLRINDDQNSLMAGERGGSLLADFILREKITHFDHA